MGKGYVIKYCKALFRKKQEELLYRTYVTDALQALVNSTGMYKCESRYRELYQNMWRKKKEQTAEEIVADVIQKAGLTLEREAE